MSSGEPDAETIEMHYRVVLDFRVLARPITPEVCRESFFFNYRNESAGDPYLRQKSRR